MKIKNRPQLQAMRKEKEMNEEEAMRTKAELEAKIQSLTHLYSTVKKQKEQVLITK